MADSLNWDFNMDSFVGTFCISFDVPASKYLLVMQAAWVKIQNVMFITFLWWHPWEARFKSGFHIFFWDLVVPDIISWMTLEIYKWNLERVLANSFWGTHKSKTICSGQYKNIITGHRFCVVDQFFYIWYFSCETFLGLNTNYIDIN